MHDDVDVSGDSRRSKRSDQVSSSRQVESITYGIGDSHSRVHIHVHIDTGCWSHCNLHFLDIDYRPRSVHRYNGLGIERENGIANLRSDRRARTAQGRIVETLKAILSTRAHVFVLSRFAFEWQRAKALFADGLMTSVDARTQTVLVHAIDPYALNEC